MTFARIIVLCRLTASNACHGPLRSSCLCIVTVWTQISTIYWVSRALRPVRTACALVSVRTFCHDFVFCLFSRHLVVWHKCLDLRRGTSLATCVVEAKDQVCGPTGFLLFSEPFDFKPLFCWVHEECVSIWGCCIADFHPSWTAMPCLKGQASKSLILIVSATEANLHAPSLFRSAALCSVLEAALIRSVLEVGMDILSREWGI